MGEYEININRSDLKFSCAHFIAFKGFRERLHGHNYTLSLRLTAQNTLSDDGYVIDFGIVKNIMRRLCKNLHEKFICPCESDVLQITEESGQVRIVCEDGSVFSFPKGDCAMLPIRHSSAEELAQYMCCAIVRELTLPCLVERHIQRIDVGIAEGVGQESRFKCNIPCSQEEFDHIFGVLPQSSFVPTSCTKTHNDIVDT
mmetsp:Transcript_22668/g.33133  ORF Transcript_22668/g.33133 Transcript_22668/m.33133 type:complete len:200 (+) Transcript_22668:43-642(+)|eukprot:CAMPEP_0185034342 /NCGR_PEP_ID=MMETSP1103-20130426/24124_1 /TAXON_ID=36769 /ORGANISM="Paraphysomonas bandaiensis, Strain Caron Lab Isolate" /LENGTH=199 /DNA_ID=CAMNT_0027570959 /DNA_START=41 /DNA_END=640 /DNA_ORIENTATION=-